MEELTLSPAGIDEVSLHCKKDLTEAGIDKKEILRLRIAVEEILGVWLERLDGAKMKCETVRNFFGNYVEITVEGPRIDIQEGDLDRQFLFVNKLIAEAAIAPAYSYGDGLNVLTIKFPNKIKIGKTAQIFITVAAAVICGCIGRLLPADLQRTVLNIAKMLFNRMNELLAAIASLLVFFSVCKSIISIGDLSLFGRIGKRTVNILLLVSFLSGLLLVSVFCFFIPIERLNGGGGVLYINEINEVVKLLVDILPSNVISPFINGNIMQILFLGLSLGTIILWCGDRTATVRDFIDESGEIVLTAMNFCLRYLPFLVFLSVVNLIFMEVSGGAATIAAMFVLSIAAYHLVLFVQFIFSVVYFRVNPKILFKKLVRIYLLGFSTCSGETVLMFFLDNSEKFLGIKKSYSGFVNSITYSVFYPVGVITNLMYAILSAEMFNVSITVQFLINSLLFSFFLSMSPSTIAMLPILFLQLGIPQEALVAAIAVNSIQRSVKRAAGSASWLLVAPLCADLNGMLDKEVLRRDVDLSASGLKR